ncbi:hypothetical protein [Amycolatopsis sp. NPDC051071]|uniref:hypothetical protein n=1 Tax=Amycolatopsis sp. NPDC051071 TaxID=3154637 RepID=UPI0034289EAA
MTDTPDPVAAIRRLHHQLRGFAVNSNLWRIQRELPGIPDYIITSAWDPDSPVLLDPKVYLGIVRGCYGTQQDIDQVLRLYQEAETAAQRAGIPSPLPAVEPSGLPRFDRIQSRADFTAVLKQLHERAGMSLRQVVQATMDFDSGHPTRKSTLSDWLQRGVIPQQEPELRVLLEVLLCSIVEPSDVAQPVEELMQAWALVRRLGPSQVIIRPAIQIDQTKLLTWLRRRHQEACERGDINHHGLAEVIQKVTANDRDLS